MQKKRKWGEQVSRWVKLGMRERIMKTVEGKYVGYI